MHAFHCFYFGSKWYIKKYLKSNLRFLIQARYIRIFFSFFECFQTTVFQTWKKIYSTKRKKKNWQESTLVYILLQGVHECVPNVQGCLRKLVTLLTCYYYAIIYMITVTFIWSAVLGIIRLLEWRHHLFKTYRFNTFVADYELTRSKNVLTFNVRSASHRQNHEKCHNFLERA